MIERDAGKTFIGASWSTFSGAITILPTYAQAIQLTDMVRKHHCFLDLLYAIVRLEIIQHLGL